MSMHMSRHVYCRCSVRVSGISFPGPHCVAACLPASAECEGWSCSVTGHPTRHPDTIYPTMFPSHPHRLMSMFHVPGRHPACQCRAWSFHGTRWLVCVSPTDWGPPQDMG